MLARGTMGMGTQRTRSAHWERKHQDGTDQEGARGLTATAACQAADTALPTFSTCLHPSWGLPFFGQARLLREGRTSELHLGALGSSCCLPEAQKSSQEAPVRAGPAAAPPTWVRFPIAQQHLEAKLPSFSRSSRKEGNECPLRASWGRPSLHAWLPPWPCYLIACGPGQGTLSLHPAVSTSVTWSPHMVLFMSNSAT